MRFSLPVRRAIGFPSAASIVELRAVLNWALFSSDGISLATAINIPNRSEVRARSPSPRSTSESRSFFSFGFVALGPPLLLRERSFSSTGSAIAASGPRAIGVESGIGGRAAGGPLRTGRRRASSSVRRGRESSIATVTEPEASDASFLLRNAVDALPEGALERQLAKGRPLRIKLGIDPTAPDIHLGHTVVLQKLREFQDRGHTVILIIGDYTGRVGDPSGRSATRPQLDPEEIDRNAETYRQQALKILDPERTEVRFNGEWLDMAAEDLFRLARTATVAQILERDDFSERFAAREPVSVLELLYPLLQGYDSVAIEADVELGGTDQKFNLLLGRQVQQAYGVEPQSILTMPILPGIDGVQRMSKSLGNYVGITDP